MVHADETGWRENGAGTLDLLRYFLIEALGEDFAGALVSEAYHHYDGPKQRCWAHLLREIHDLRAEITGGPTPCILPPGYGLQSHFAKQRRGPTGLGKTPAGPLPSLPGRWRSKASCAGAFYKHVKELFVFMAEPEVPPDNNAAERSLRPLVISRKISGGTRSR